jgi:hypothetical protein
MESRGRGALGPRRSLSSGAHSRDPLAGTTIGGAATSARRRVYPFFFTSFTAENSIPSARSLV